jgi:hypothetical protein
MENVEGFHDQRFSINFYLFSNELFGYRKNNFWCLIVKCKKKLPLLNTKKTICENFA